MLQSRPLRLLALLASSGALAVAATGCASDDRSRSGLFQPYRIEVPQGNYVDQAMFGQVKPGMSREQVRFALGTPLLVDPFRPDRWDYVFRFQHPNGSADLRRATVHFAQGRVERLESDALPVSDEGADPALPGYRRKQGRNR
jgi:outer membrane protein assembly factor BamE